MYKDNWTQPWPVGSEIYPKIHENPRAVFNSSSPILLEPLAHGPGSWSLPREDCIKSLIYFILYFYKWHPMHYERTILATKGSGRCCFLNFIFASLYLHCQHLNLRKWQNRREYKEFSKYSFKGHFRGGRGAHAIVYTINYSFPLQSEHHTLHRFQLWDDDHFKTQC